MRHKGIAITLLSPFIVTFVLLILHILTVPIPLWVVFAPVFVAFLICLAGYYFLAAYMLMFPNRMD